MVHQTRNTVCPRSSNPPDVLQRYDVPPQSLLAFSATLTRVRLCFYSVIHLVCIFITVQNNNQTELTGRVKQLCGLNQTLTAEINKYVYWRFKLATDDVHLEEFLVCFRRCKRERLMELDCWTSIVTKRRKLVTWTRSKLYLSLFISHENIFFRYSLLHSMINLEQA